ncbi:hypothetical protein C8F04DRAFT_1262916 [Mycena alexandri]|uniref:SWIM-type domain-containing protein n=1 Tax=Mycena alexandri TaxID=1745969 RepID=A0AAD6SPH0_9AGAR|nr:hypothetical protein C8F04DRAFT_1262916 [Mycena alexandri]
MANPGGPPHVRYYTVYRNKSGAFICDCPQYRATAKTCPDIVAARHYIEFGPPTHYNKAEQGLNERGPQTKGKGKVPARNSTGKKGQKLNIPMDIAVDDVHEKLLDLLNDDDEWNPFAAQENRATEEGKKTPSEGKGKFWHVRVSAF